MPDKSKALRLGMVGGGAGAFIGPVHRMGAELDGTMRLVAGAFSQDAERSRAAGAAYGIDPARAYPDHRTMIEMESKREDGIDLVAIVTPNHMHLPVARAAMKAGLDVISDKPATATLDEALELQGIVKETGRLYALTFTYTGYPMIREARELIRNGALGRIRKVMVEYLQGWLSEAIEGTGQKQAAWRADPAKAGVGGCIGDIGVHAFNLIEYVTGLEVTSLHADLRSVVSGRVLDDDCTVLLGFNNGAHGVLAASQIATGERNGLRLRVYGERGSLDWQQESPNSLTLRLSDGPDQVLHAGSPGLSTAARSATRLPAGHPEGLIEAFANIYRDFGASVRGRIEDAQSGLAASLCGIEDGVRSMAFVDCAVHANRSGWIDLKQHTLVSLEKKP